MQHAEPNYMRQFSRLFWLLKPHHKSIVKAMLIGPIIGLLSIAPPYFTKLLFDQVALSYDVTLMQVLVAGIVAFSLTAALSEALLHYYSNYLNIKLENTTQLLFFNHIQHLPLSFFQNREVGEISSRFGEVKAALGSVHAFFNIVFGQGILLLLVPPFLFYLNWKLALVALIAVPLSSAVIYWISNKLRSSWQQVIESHAQVDAYQLEMLNQITSVKVLQLERTLFNKTSGQLTHLLDAHMRTRTLTALFMLFDKSVTVLNLGLFTWLGWVFILDGEMSIGDYVAFAAYIGYLRAPMTEVITLVTSFQQWAIHINRIFEFLDVKPEQNPRQVSHSLPTKHHEVSTDISCENLSFIYPESGKGLTDLNLHIPAGQIVALAGASGSGKSTLIKLITGIEQEYSGLLMLAGNETQQLNMSEQRSYLSVVWQQVELFRGSIEDNLLLGTQNVSDEALNHVIDLCCLREVVEALPQGLATQLGENGTNLSGGQRQRVAIARALLRCTPVMLFDEATSSLDAETEQTVCKNVIAYAKKHRQTLVYSTHNLAMAAHADCIYVFDEGQMVDSGDHQSLLSSSKRYQALHAISRGPISK